MFLRVKIFSNRGMGVGMGFAFFPFMFEQFPNQGITPRRVWGSGKNAN